MATVSRGQVITRNRVQEAFDFLTKNVSDAVKMVQQRKQLDLMQEQIHNEKWRMMHDALWKAFEADARTNQYGARGAFQNFKDPLTQLYSMAGMKPEAIDQMWKGIEESGLSPDILKKAAYSYYLTNEDLSNVEPEQISQATRRLVQEQVEAGITYPEVKETRSENIMVQEPTAGGPMRLNQNYYDELKNLMIIKTQNVMEDRGLLPGQTPAEDLESGITIFGKKIPLKVERTAKREERMNEAKGTVLDEVVRQYTAGTGLRPEHVNQLRAEIEAVMPGFQKGVAPTEMAGVMPSGAPYAPKSTEGVVEVRGWIESREMTPQEKLEYRRQLVQENKLPTPVADALIKSDNAKAAMDNFIKTGTIPSPRAQAEMKTTAGRMRIALKKPAYADNLKGRLDAMMPSVIRQLGRAFGGPNITDEQAEILGQQNLVGIMERDYLIAKTDMLRYQLQKEQWDVGNKRFVTIELPPELGGGTRELTFNQFTAYWQLQNDLLRMQMSLAASQQTGGMDMDFVLDLMKFNNTFMEPYTSLPADKFQAQLDVLYANNDMYKWSTDLLIDIYKRMNATVDEEGNIIGLPEIYERAGYQPGFLGRLLWQIPGNIGNRWQPLPGGRPTLTPPEGTQQPEVQEQNLRDDEAVTDYINKKRGQ